MLSQFQPLPGDNGYMHTSWPFGLDHLGDAYRYRRREPMKYRSPSRSPILWGQNRDGTPHGGYGSDGSGFGGPGDGSGYGRGGRDGAGDGFGGRSGDGIRFRRSRSRSRSPSPRSGDEFASRDKNWGDRDKNWGDRDKNWSDQDKNRSSDWDDNLGDDKNKASGSALDDLRNKLIEDGKVAALKNSIEGQEAALKGQDSLQKRSKSVPPGDSDIVKRAVAPTTKSTPTTPLPDLMSNLRHIKVSTVPVPVPPKFGTLSFGSANVAEGPAVDGPPCILCHKPIAEKRCINHETFQYHCWHFVCSFCFKTLKENDFMMAVDNKPYCNNCFKRMFP